MTGIPDRDSVTAATDSSPSFNSGDEHRPAHEGLCDVERFGRLWLLSRLDRAGPVRMKVVPDLDTTERGLSATRAPSRPNPIGLFDGTPPLDIKPYAPQIDVFGMGGAGWLAAGRGRSSADDRFELD